MSKKKAKNAKRTKRLIDAIISNVVTKGLQVHSYNRSDINNVFTQFEANTKYQIAKKIIYWFPYLAELEPPVRKRWMSENHNMGVFTAISLAVTHFYHNQ